MEPELERITKIAILGPESSGKSSLSKELAQRFNTSYSTEIARDYLSQRDGNYRQKELLEIARLQIREEEKKLKEAKKVLFCDTNLLNILIWSEVKYGTVDPQLQSLWHPEEFDLSILCYPDLPYEEDDLRESPELEDRVRLFKLHEEYLKRSNSKYKVIRGLGEVRIKNAVKIIDHFMG